MPRRKGVRWRPFFEARAFVHALGLKNKNEWRAYSRSGQRPDDIPGSPEEHYAAEWRGTGDWLGTGTVATKDREYRAFAEARAFVRALGLKSAQEWQAYSRSGQKPDDIPSHPAGVYAAEWRSWGDWLGTGTVATKDREYRAFAEARAFVRALGLKNQHEWYTYSRSDQRPDDINRCRANR